MQLRFASFAVVNSWWDSHPQDCAHAGRTKRKKPAFAGGFRVSRAYRDGAQKRVRMPIVPTIWFGVLDAPPDPLMKAW